jgi:hypothetical protein
VVAAAVIVSLVVTGGWWVLTRPSHAPAAGQVAPTADGGGAAGQAGSVGTSGRRPRVDPDAVRGRWQRADGDYIIEIRSVAADGSLEAGYYNPAPIHVSRARLTMADGVPRVFVELRDVNYPGSTYTLTYEPASDQLAGVYFQAVQQQTFDVVFERRR